MSSIACQLSFVRSTLPEGVKLVAVSKTHPAEAIRAAYDAGHRVFGESRPQELREKHEALPKDIEWHMIGHLQTNKVREVVGNVTLIQSVSSLHLAEAISKRGVSHDVTSDVLLEVNVSGEESKSGFSPDEVRAALDDILALPALRVRGLMTMAPAHDMDAARRTFSGLRELRDELASRSGLELPVLSCGMSDDFPIAVEEGSTIVRLGRTVFDPSYVLG